MKILPLLITLFALCACTGLPQPVATSPLPTDELTAYGLYSNKIGSMDIAIESAEKFCKRWGAGAGITGKRVSYRGQAIETTGSFGSEVVRSLKSAVTGVGSRKDAYETGITYRCY